MEKISVTNFDWENENNLRISVTFCSITRREFGGSKIGSYEGTEKMLVCVPEFYLDK